MKMGEMQFVLILTRECRLVREAEQLECPGRSYSGYSPQDVSLPPLPEPLPRILVLVRTGKDMDEGKRSQMDVAREDKMA